MANKKLFLCQSISELDQPHWNLNAAVGNVFVNERNAMGVTVEYVKNAYKQFLLCFGLKANV